MLSPEGQQVFAQFGFAPVGPPATERRRFLRRFNRGMDGDANLDRLAFSKFAVGQPVPRNEDQTLLRGQGRYTDDLSLPGQAYAVIVRSRYAHGVIKAIDIEEALAPAERPRHLYRARFDRGRHQVDAARPGDPDRRW